MYYFKQNLRHFEEAQNYSDDEEEYEDDETDEEEEEEDEDEEDDEEDDEDLALPIICKCTNCKDKNTLKLCYKMLDLNEKASKAQVKAKYLSLISAKEKSFDTNNNNSSNKPDESAEQMSDENECNLNKLIKNLTKNKLFTINESDRIEIITKAYNLIMGNEVMCDAGESSQAPTAAAHKKISNVNTAEAIVKEPHPAAATKLTSMYSKFFN